MRRKVEREKACAMRALLCVSVRLWKCQKMVSSRRNDNDQRPLDPVVLSKILKRYARNTERRPGYLCERRPPMVTILAQVDYPDENGKERRVAYQLSSGSVYLVSSHRIASVLSVIIG